MKEQFVSYRIALALKKLEFDEECLGVFVCGDLLITSDSVYSSKDIPVIKAPLWQQTIDWFREKHSIYTAILPYRNNEDNIELCWYYSIVEDSEELYGILCNEIDLGATDELIDSYEEAREAAILKAIEIIKNKQ